MNSGHYSEHKVAHRPCHLARLWVVLPDNTSGVMTVEHPAHHNEETSNNVKGASKIEILGSPAGDERYLDLWRDVPVNHWVGASLGRGEHRDQYEQVIAIDATGEVFRRAADRLMRYQFYPPDIMTAVTDASVAGRWLRVSDRLLQRVRVLRVFGQPVVELLTVNEVVSVVDEPRRKGFTYVTTCGHSEQGEWSAEVTWRADDAVVLHVRARSRSTWRLPWPLSAIVRRFQLHAHRRGIQAFINRLASAQVDDRVAPD